MNFMNFSKQATQHCRHFKMTLRMTTTIFPPAPQPFF